MPEIAEVALTAQILEKYIKGKILYLMNFTTGRYTKKLPVGYKEFMEDLPLKVVRVNSRGKFMWFELEKLSEGKNKTTNKTNKWYIFNTFGLTGMWSLIEPDKYKAVMNFEDLCVYYSDQRNFGTFKFVNNEKELQKKLASLKQDFLKDENINLDGVKKYNIPIVKILMDQTKVGSGIGNYLASEILYRAKLSPHRLGSSLSNKEITKLTYWIKYVIKLSYMDNHIGYMVNLEGENNHIHKINYHPAIKLKEKTFKFLVYRRKTDPLGNPVKGDKIVGPADKKRTTYWVPAVQI